MSLQSRNIRRPRFTENATKISQIRPEKKMADVAAGQITYLVYTRQPYASAMVTPDE